MSNFKQPWLIRKLVYYGAALVIFALVGFGVISDVQADQLLEQSDKIFNIILGSIFLMAGRKANEQSDQAPPGRHRANE